MFLELLEQKFFLIGKLGWKQVIPSGKLEIKPYSRKMSHKNFKQ